MRSTSRCADCWTCFTLLAPPDPASSDRDRARVYLRRVLLYCRFFQGGVRQFFRHKSTELVDGPGIGATYRQNFELPSTAKKLPSKKGNPSTAKNLPCCVTAVKVPSKFDLPSTAKNLPSTRIPYKNYRQLSYRMKTTVNSHTV